MDEKINIGIFIDTFFPNVDGVVVVVDNYAKRLCANANVTVFAPFGRSEYDDSKFPYKVVRCKYFRVPFLDYDLPRPKTDRVFLKALNESKLDIIHIHSPFSLGRIGVKYAKEHNIPVVATFHSQFKRDFKRAAKSELITNILLNKAMKVFNSVDEGWAVNKEIGDVYIDYGFKKTPIVYNNGTDMRLVESPEAACKAVNEKHSISENENVFLFVGRINKLKNIFFIVDALRIVKEKGYGFKMLFVGSGQDEDALRAKIKKHELEDEIILCGRVMDRELLKAYYYRADLFLFPSLYDASSLVQIEAASQKTPTIFLKGAVTAGTVTNEVNGFVVENSVDAFAEKIIMTINDKDYYAQISENAYRDLFVTWDEAVNRARNRYSELINERKNSLTKP